MSIVDLSFSLSGGLVPVDHGYALFGAISRICPKIHGAEGVGVHPINGVPEKPGSGLLSLTDRSRLTIRLSSEAIADYLPLSGADLDITGHKIRVGYPRVEKLAPAPDLASRFVTSHGAEDCGRFQRFIGSELARLGIMGEPRFFNSQKDQWSGRPQRRVIRVKGAVLVGYPILVAGLAAEESLRLQESGLGAKRRFGAGLFSAA